MDGWMLCIYWGWEVGLTSEEEVENSGESAFCWLGSELSMTGMTLSQFGTHMEKWKSNSLHTQTTHGPLWFLYKVETDALVSYLPNVHLYAFLPAVHPADYASRLVDSTSLAEQCYECNSHYTSVDVLVRQANASTRLTHWWQWLKTREHPVQFYPSSRGSFLQGVIESYQECFSCLLPSDSTLSSPSMLLCPQPLSMNSIPKQ